MNMLATIAPKSDQLNADDLIGCTRTITVTKVSMAASEQPVSISFEGDNNKPFKPGKSMRRVLVKAWGPDANSYAGRSMTLYRDDKVRFGGMEVGGIRISHMSDIPEKLVMALTETKGKKALHTVYPLAPAKPDISPPQPTPFEWFTKMIPALNDRKECTELLKPGTKRKALFDGLNEADQEAVKEQLADKMAEFMTGPQTPAAVDNGFPGDIPPPEDAR